MYTTYTMYTMYTFMCICKRHPIWMESKCFEESVSTAQRRFYSALAAPRSGAPLREGRNHRAAPAADQAAGGVRFGLQSDPKTPKSLTELSSKKASNSKESIEILLVSYIVEW